jgi:hypothetical protein
MGSANMYPNLHVWLDRIDAVLTAAPADDRVKDARRAAGILRQMLTPPAPDRPAGGDEARAEGVKLSYLLGWIKAGVAAGQPAVPRDVADAANAAVASFETVLGAPDPVSVLDCNEYMSRPSPCPPARPGI